MVEAEEHIIESAKRGEAQAFGVLYTTYVAPMYRFIALKVPTKQEAEDLTHEVFVSAWDNIKRYKKRGNPFSSWLYSIARNKVIDHYRTRHSHLALDTIREETVGYDAMIAESLDQEFKGKTVREAMRRLSEEHQTVIILRFIEDLSPKEIAKIMKKSEGAIRVAQHRAIQSLKRLLNTNL